MTAVKRVIRFGIATSLLLVPVISHAEPISLQLRAPATARLGEAVPLSVVFSHEADEALYVDFSGSDYGTESLVICAYGADKLWKRVGQIHLDRDVAARRFDFIPLRPGQRFESPILSINDPAAGALPILRLANPGTYELFARFESRGPSDAGVIWPIWRGAVQSEPQRLTLLPASEDVVRNYRERLSTCLSDTVDCDSNAIGYFTTVRDVQAADVLARILDAAVAPDIALAYAVANQLGTRARESLRRFGERFPSYTEFVANLLAPQTDEFICTNRK